jgi:hypothetical protein
MAHLSTTLEMNERARQRPYAEQRRDEALALEERLDIILSAIRAEVLRAGRKHPPMHSAHEGYAVLQEEVDELWEHVKADTGYSAEAMTEASQVAAMGVRYMLDLGGRK